MKTLVIIFVITLGVVFPRPSLRVEKIDVIGNYSTAVVSSSIMDHNSVCTSSTLRRLLSNEFTTIGNAGLNPEEVSFLINKHELSEPIIVTGLYFLFAERNYGVSKHVWYRQKIDGKLFEKPPWTKTKNKIPFKVRDGIDADINLIRGKVRKLQHECDASSYQISSPDLRHFEYTYYQLSNDWKSQVVSNLDLLNTPSSNVVVIFPTQKFVPLKSRKSMDEVEIFLGSMGVKIMKPDLSDLDEPWCLCGHLSNRGQRKLVDLLVRL